MEGLAEVEGSRSLTPQDTASVAAYQIRTKPLENATKAVKYGNRKARICKALAVGSVTPEPKVMRFEPYRERLKRQQVEVAESAA